VRTRHERARNRVPPAPATGRKPQTGAAGRKDSIRSAVGARLDYLVWLQAQENLLEDLVAQERDLWREHMRSLPARAQPRFPSTLTAGVRLKPIDDPVLNLNEDSLLRLDPSGQARFDPHRPAVAANVTFLGSRRDLPTLGFIPVVEAGDQFFGWINLDRVARFAQHPAVVRIEALRSLTPSGAGPGSPGTATSRPAAALAAESGAGVRLAVIDLGFDILHPGLVRVSGGAEATRVLWLHDFVLPALPNAPAGSFGRRFDAADLDAALSWYAGANTSPKPAIVATHLLRLKDVGSPAYRTLAQQHGTATTGLAAGNGRTSPPPSDDPRARPGIAPDADLVLLAVGAHDEMRFADALDIHSAFSAAFDDHSAPCVALLANSDNLGPHDGTLGGERALDHWLLTPGRAIVLSAGNLNHSASSAAAGPAWHAVSEADSGQSPQPLVLCYGSGAPWPDCAEIWFRPKPGEAAQAIVEIEVRNAAVGPPITIMETAQPITILSPADNPSDQTTAEALLRFDPLADAYCLSLFIRPAVEIARSEWKITIAAEEPVHGWLDRNNESAGRWIGLPAQNGSDRTTLGSPASSTRPLTVGSLANVAGRPSAFSGRGPVRAPADGARKPDLVAVGEGTVGPRGDPAARWHHHPPSGPYRTFPPGTSYAAPQVAGACVLLFERFGPAATWSDIRQAILQATVRGPQMPVPEPDGWDSACGYGALDLDLLHSPPAPLQADVFLAKADQDTGIEPFVAARFWQSPAIVLEDRNGAVLDPHRVATGEVVASQVRVHVSNRGGEPARDLRVQAWWAPLGALHPLPDPNEGGGAWQALKGQIENAAQVPGLAPGEISTAVFDFAPPRDASGAVIPHVLLATAGASADPFDPHDTLCAQNNAAALCVAAAQPGGKVDFHIIGSDDVDGLIIWSDEPHAPIRIENLPVCALPWRDAGLYEAGGFNDRPLYGSPKELPDLASTCALDLEGEAAIRDLTEVQGAMQLRHLDGLVSIEGVGRLFVPRLRIAQGARLALTLCSAEHTAGALHLLHLSGGRRVGGGSVTFAAPVT
jgi:Subtilase family